MDKNTEIKSTIKFVEQPIFIQVMDLVQKVNISSLIRTHDANHYYKAFKARTHLIVMLFGILAGLIRLPKSVKDCELWVEN